MINEILAERNAGNLNQVEGTLLTIKALVSLIGKDSVTIFSQ